MGIQPLQVPAACLPCPLEIVGSNKTMNVKYLCKVKICMGIIIAV
jgi:hypothetical protein